MTENAPKKFRLSFVNAAEDVPRLVRAYGRACQGEFALVLRPPEQRGVLVLVRKEGATFWRSGEAPAPDTRRRAKARVQRVQDGSLRLVALTGGERGVAWVPYEPQGLVDGQEVTMAYDPDDQFAHVVVDRTPAHSDAPGVPASAVSAKDAVTLIKTEQKATPKPGPITIRGQWSGWLHCDSGTPRVELVRKLAAYGVLTIISTPEGWSWSVARTEKWFSKPGADTGTAPTLLKAIEGGLARAMGLLGEACSVRDSHRRAALDTAFAVEHPIKPAHEGKDPTERLRPKEPRKTKARAPAPMDAPVSLPDVPVTAPALHRMADEVTAEADALESVRGLPWVWQESSAKDDAVAWFSQVGLDDLAEEVSGYDGGPDRPLDTFIGRLRELVTDADVDEPTRQDALVQITRLHDGWKTAPALLERARRLVRYAARMSESELCRGHDQREAVEAVQRAVQSYGEARDAIGRGEPFDGIRKLRSIAQWVALAAAKAAKACAAGQINLPSGKAAADEGLQPGDRASLASDPRRVGTVVEWRDEDRVVWHEDGQRIRAVLHPSKLRAAVDVDVEPPSGRSDLVVVPLGGTPSTAAELLAVVTGHTNTFQATPNAANAKKWMKGALLHLGIEAVSLSAKTVGFDDVGGGTRAFVRVVLPAQLEGNAEVERKMRLIDEALGKKAAPKISLEGWVYGAEGARTVKPSATTPPSTPVPEVDAAKDKALIDAFSAAVAAALGGT
jgi:hypothetical protein